MSGSNLARDAAVAIVTRALNKQPVGRKAVQQMVKIIDDALMDERARAVAIACNHIQYNVANEIEMNEGR